MHIPIVNVTLDPIQMEIHAKVRFLQEDYGCVELMGKCAIIPQTVVSKDVINRLY